MTFGPLGKFEVVPPPGLTDTGRIRRFQDRTVARLKQRAQEIGRVVLGEARSGVATTYVEGEGTLLSSLQARTVATRDGVSIEFIAGGRHLVYLTTLAGQPGMSMGHWTPKTGRSRFYWKNPLHGLPPGMYYMDASKNRRAFWKTRQGRDILAEVLGAGAQTFTTAMIAEHDRALVEFVQNDLQVSTKTMSEAVRVNVAGR